MVAQPNRLKWTLHRSALQRHMTCGEAGAREATADIERHHDSTTRSPPAQRERPPADGRPHASPGGVPFGVRPRLSHGLYVDPYFAFQVLSFLRWSSEALGRTVLSEFRKSARVTFRMPPAATDAAAGPSSRIGSMSASRQTFVMSELLYPSVALANALKSASDRAHSELTRLRIGQCVRTGVGHPVPAGGGGGSLQCVHWYRHSRLPRGKYYGGWGGGEALGPKNLCTKNGPTRFSQR